MSDRKEKILAHALELFAKDGYAAVSTSKIAKRAEVSEGLIFRHFETKKGLLDAIVEQAREKTINLFAPIILQADPTKAIKMAISFPLEIPKEEYPFWRLQFKLQWEPDRGTEHKMEPLTNKLAWAFAQLKYKSPKNEAQILVYVIEGILMSVLHYGPGEQIPLKKLLFKKYTS